MDMNNQHLMTFDGFEFVSPPQETDQEVSPIILNSFEDNQQSSQMNNLMPPNQVIDVNRQTPIRRTQNIDSLMNNQDLMKFKAVLVDSSVDISPSSPYLNQNGYMIDTNTMFQQGTDNQFSIIDNNLAGTRFDGLEFVSPPQETDQEVVSPYSPIILNSFEDNQQSSQMNNLKPSNNLPNQVTGENTLTPIPRAQNMDSLMNNQDLMKFKTVLVDPPVYISPSSSSNYLNQNGYMIDANTMFQQGTDNQFSIIGNNLAGTSSVGVIEDNIHENTGVASIIPNTGNQVEVKLAQPNLMDEQQAIPSCSNSKNFEDKSQVAQIIDIKPKNKVSSGNPGPLRRTKVGRCPQDETPLYLQPQPQPENKDELKRWRRAKTAYEHRQKKKNTLTGDAKKIEDMIRERDELKSQIETVTAQRNAYKTTVDSLINQKQR